MIRLMIADDHPIVCEGVRRIIEDCPDMEVVGEAVDGDDLRTKLDTTKADVLLLDISMPGPGFLSTMEWLRAEHPATRVLVLSVHSEEQYALRALRAGAAGYLTKEHSPLELAEAIRRIDGGGKYITPTLAEKLAFDLDPTTDKKAHASGVDDRRQSRSKYGTKRPKK